MTEARDEVEAIRGRYARRGGTRQPPSYSLLDAYTLRARQEREREIVRWARREGMAPVGEKTVLEVGCGSGANLLDLIRLGFRPENLTGNDLLEGRLDQARKRLPESVTLLAGDAAALDLEEGSFDVVLQSTVFSSILDDGFQERLAGRMWALARPGGGVLWYDFIRDNPRNSDVRGVPLARIRRLFPGGPARPRRLTLAPPIGRRLCRIWPALYPAANSLLFLRTHVLCWIQKPSGSTAR